MDVELLRKKDAESKKGEQVVSFQQKLFEQNYFSR